MAMCGMLPTPDDAIDTPSLRAFSTNALASFVALPGPTINTSGTDTSSVTGTTALNGSEISWGYRAGLMEIAPTELSIRVRPSVTEMTTEVAAMAPVLPGVDTTSSG